MSSFQVLQAVYHGIETLFTFPLCWWNLTIHIAGRPARVLGHCSLAFSVPALSKRSCSSNQRQDETPLATPFFEVYTGVHANNSFF